MGSEMAFGTGCSITFPGMAARPTGLLCALGEAWRAVGSSPALGYLSRSPWVTDMRDERGDTSNQGAIQRMGRRGTSKTTEPRDRSVVGLDGTPNITEPWDHSVVGAEGTLKITEPWDHSVVGLDGTPNIRAMGSQHDWVGWDPSPPSSPPLAMGWALPISSGHPQPHPWPRAPPGTEHPQLWAVRKPLPSE